MGERAHARAGGDRGRGGTATLPLRPQRLPGRPGDLARLFALAAAAFLVGCSGSEELVEPAELKELVLQPADLGDGYRRFDDGPLVRAESPRGEDGWKARYRWSGSADAAVPLVVESRVDLFESADDAKEGLRALRGDLEGEGRELPDLGEQAAVTTFTRGDVRFFTVAWRDRNVLATLSANGFDGRIASRDVLELARVQARRLRTR